VGLFILPLALGNLLGPVMLGHFFDTIGRRRMITGTYAVAGVLLAATAWGFYAGIFTAWTQTGAWIAIFFFASAAASSAYLTVSEIFPLETRALAIALFYALGTLIGGVAAPLIFGKLIGQSVAAIACGYLGAAALMLIAAGVEAWLGIDAEGKSLEEIAQPLSA
jgi:MFS family permease